MMAKSRAKKADAAEISVAPVPETKTLAVVRDAALNCRACSLYKNATQTVFGEGTSHAKLAVLSEQSGDAEDLAEHPFVGPAGQLLDRALAEVGINRKLAYVINSVKHFRWEPSGKKRLHKKASPREIAACRPWLEGEMRIIAAQPVLGPDVRVLCAWGQFVLSDFSPQTFITVHPALLLRVPDEETRARDYAQFVLDLRFVAGRLQ